MQRLLLLAETNPPGANLTWPGTMLNIAMNCARECFVLQVHGLLSIFVKDKGPNFTNDFIAIQSQQDICLFIFQILLYSDRYTISLIL